MSLPTQYMHLIDVADLTEWLKKADGVPVRRSALALKLLDEVLELCYASGATTEEVQKCVNTETAKAIDRREANGYYDADKVYGEIGDVGVSFGCFVHYANVMLPQAISACTERIKGREWAPDQDGILRRPR